MSLPEFLNGLLHEGRVRVDPIPDPGVGTLVNTPEELDEAAGLLETFEREYRVELAHVPPPWTRAASLWAAQSLWHASRLLISRDAGPQLVRSALAEPCPEAASPPVVYSVDLSFRFLPDLMRLARAASPDDPLVPIVDAWARHWPLSSVGMGALEITGSLDWLDDPCLRQLYVDRILAEQDESRLADPRTLEAVRESVGRHFHLVPRLAARLAAK